MADRPSSTMVASSGGVQDRFWYFRFWNGMPLSVSLALLLRNRFQVGLLRIGMTGLVLFSALVNSLFGILQKLFLGRRIERTQIEEDPIFIVGHWRTGTTLLHELLVLDPRHTFPDNYACFAPAHFVFSRKLLAPVFRHLLPSKRPIDNMELGWDRPQEDEFALCNLGAHSPYLTMAFPNRPPPGPGVSHLRRGTSRPT